MQINRFVEKIKKSWDIELYSTYASTEMNTAFTECKYQLGGHHHPELIIVEILNDTDKPKDVLFEFNKKNSDPNYSEFNFLTSYSDTTGLGFKTNKILLLWQKSSNEIKPDPTNWAYSDISNYLGTNGCVTGVMKITGTEFELHADIYDYVTELLPTHSVIDTNVYDVFELGAEPVGEIIVIFNGTVQTEASDDTLTNGTYYRYPKTYAVGPNNRDVIVFGQGYGVSSLPGSYVRYFTREHYTESKDSSLFL